MKSYFLFTVFLVKILLSSTNIYFIKAPDKDNIELPDDDIGCFHCGSRIKLGNTFSYDAPARIFSNKDYCINSINNFAIADKSSYSCAVTILYNSVPVYDVIEYKQQQVIDLLFSAVSNNDCLEAKAKNNSDIVCNDSSCKKIILCCDEKNYCNTPERFTLLGVLAYTDVADINLKNSYLRYTYSKCQLSSTAIAETRYQECVLSIYNSTFNTKPPYTDFHNVIPPCDSGTVNNIKVDFLPIITIIIYMLF